MATVRKALAGHGSFSEYRASSVTDARGEIWRRPFDRSWDEIDWQDVPARASLSDLERAVLHCLLDDHEPTWIVAADPEVSADRVRVKAVLDGLEEKKLVTSVLAASGESGRESEPDRWWAVTDEGWDLLGMIKPPSYGP
jgi:hypothetical protein